MAAPPARAAAAVAPSSRLANSPYSFVIPVLDEADHIAGLLATLRRQFPLAQLIVVDGGSSDDTVQLASPLADHVLHSAPGRALQMNQGAQAATGEYLFFLHADSLPGVDADALAGYLAAAPAWGFCRVRLSGEEWYFRLISSFINWRSRLTRVATTSRSGMRRR